MAFRIYLSPPHMGGREMEYIKEAFDTNWIAPYGPSINAFEGEMAKYVGVESALALTSGTAGIHLALRWLGVQQGDTVFCSDFTFIGSCGAILYEKCEPVFIDSEPDSWNMSPIALEKAFQWAKREGKMPKAVIIVDLYGESADWDNLLPICRKYGVPVIEDAAEALGTEYKGKKCGSFGDLSVLSFNGNKVITTSGGGMVLSNDKMAIEKMRFWSTQAREPVIWYEHKEYGYNYRMSNICACIGRGQLEFLPQKLQTRKEIHMKYRRELDQIPAHIKRTAEKGCSNYWLNLLHIDTDAITPAEIVTRLQNAQIETRPAWKPMHMQPLFRDAAIFSHNDDDLPCVGEIVFDHTVCLPSGDGMSTEQQQEVIDELKACFAGL
jgi:pyridoxal phosphate-dependent aminotransferase EpsN